MTNMGSMIDRIPVLRGVVWRIRTGLASARRGRAFRRKVSASSPLRIVIGASGIFDDGWIPTEIDLLDMRDVRQWRRLFDQESIDALFAEHVWEHLTEADGLLAAINCYQFLKPGGYLRVAVPDGFHPDPAYIEWVRVGGTGAGADDHKVLYNCNTFSSLFEKAGFRTTLQEYFDESGVFHSIGWDSKDGTVHRSLRFDERNRDGKPNYTSIILDAHKD